MPLLSIPTTSSLPSSLLLSSTNTAIVKSLNRLSRTSLISLALDWLDPRNQETIATYLTPEHSEDGNGDEDDIYPPVPSLRDLREIYRSLQASKGSKRDVIDRITEGDWRRGLSLYQLAMVDMQYLHDHPTSQKWSALKVVKIESEVNDRSNRTTTLPRFHPATFLRNLRKENLPDVKAYYNLDRHAKLPLLILRVFVLESPYNTNYSLQSAAQVDSSKTFYVAFPDASPYVYVSLTVSTGISTTRSETRSLRKLTLDGIPKAFSRPRQRYSLEPTSLSARNLEALVQMRANGRTTAAGGGWGIYADKNEKDTPLHPTKDAFGPLDVKGSPENMAENKQAWGIKRRVEHDAILVKRRKVIAQGRFGNSARAEDGKGIERLDVRIKDEFSAIFQMPVAQSPPLASEEQVRKRERRITPSFEVPKQDAVERIVEDDVWRPEVRITFQGQHVFAGIRTLVEEGIVDGKTMPGWMTGEENVSHGVVRHGRITGRQGCGV